METLRIAVAVIMMIPYLSAGNALATENVLVDTAQRDMLFADKLIEIGRTLKCLTEFVGGPDTIKKIYEVFDSSMNTFQKSCRSLPFDQYFDVGLVASLVFLEKIRSIDKLCADLTNVCCQYRNSKPKADVPVEIRELEMLMEKLGMTTKCLLRNLRDVDGVAQIHEIFGNAILEIRRSYNRSITVVEAMHLPVKTAIEQLEKLDTRCSNIAVSSHLCQHSNLGQKE